MPGSTTQVRFSTSSERIAVQVFGEIDDDPAVDGLAALRSAAAARGHDQAVVAGDRKRAQRLIDGAGDHDPERHDLVERRVGGVAAAVEGAEKDVTGQICPQASLES